MKKTYTCKRVRIVALSGFISLLTFFSNVSAQIVDVQIGTQSGTSSNLPINAYYGYSYSQQIITAADLNTAGINGAAKIQKIRFYKTSSNLSNSNGWTVLIGHTSKSTFSSNTDWELGSNLQTVFSGTVTDPGANAWLEVTFSTPFIWDGLSNIIIAVDENASGYSSSNISFATTSSGTNATIYYQNDSTNPDPASPPSASSRLFTKNVMQLVAELPLDCVGTPAMSTILSNVGTTVCEGTNVTLSIQNATTTYFANGLEYQWQSFDGSNWNDIQDANSATYTVNDIDATTNYQVQITCTYSDQFILLSPLNINVNPNPNVVVDVSEGAFCPASTVAINASGAVTYSWTPAAGLNVANAATVNASPVNTTLYTVTGTDVNGCSSTAQSIISPYGQLQTIVSSTPVELCNPNIPVEVSVESNFEVNGGTWEYRFLDGTTELQGWNATNAYQFIPTQDSIYTVWAQMRNTACANALDSVQKEIAVGFGLEEISVVDYNCVNIGGSATLIDVFGQREISEIYDNNFNTPTNTENWVLAGNASFTDNRLQLTASATSQKGSAVLTVPNFEAGANNSFSVSFDLTADLPINTYGTEGADGVAYSFGDNLVHPTGSAHNGVGNKLRLSFDSAANGSENNNEPGVYLVYGWTNAIAYGPASSQVLGYSSNTALWKNKTNIPVTLQINAAGFATVTVDGVVLINQVAMPAAYLNEDVSTWKHMFSAGTGGDAMRHTIDNIKIDASSLVVGITESASAAPVDWQASNSFTGLAPGTYYVWAAKNPTSDCNKQIGMFEVLNVNPLVDLGADTTICQGETLLLDAGNPGSTYVWSGTTSTSQTLEVSNAGTYTVYATAANGCFGIGNINVQVNDVPSATTIYRQGFYPTFTYTVLNAQNADAYNWNFGDGIIVNNGPATIQHTYSNEADVTVTVTLTNRCGSTPISASFADLAIDHVDLLALSIVPNPVVDQFSVTIATEEQAVLSVIATTGAVVFSETEFTNAITVNTDHWESGIYFVSVTTQGINTIKKIIVR